MTPGTKLGPYEVLAPLGAGGMGEVYRARDTRLDRTVAIKILPNRLADRAELRERFEREARTIASLNHPHICTLHDIGHQDGTDYLVMECLEGETLAQRLTKGPLPLAQVLQYSIQIADALDKAHRKGVTHRDLKPGNIMLTKSGAKLLDFGLAKLRQETSPAAAISQLPTASQPITAQGTIVGTLQYMAPEQLEGKEADARTDIFAFGTVVYEMLTGKKAFEGKSQASVMAKILEVDPPPISTLQPMTPPALDRAVKKCLAKEPDERWQSAGDLHDELKWIAETGPQSTSSAASRAPFWRRVLPWSIAGALAIAVATLAWAYMFTGSNSGDLEPVRFQISPPENAALASSGVFAVSPDGRQLAFLAAGADGAQRVWVRALDSLEAHPLPDSESPGVPPIFWSFDSRYILFDAGGKLKKVDVEGGPAQTLCDIPGQVVGGSWSRNGVIIFGVAGRGIMKVSANGGMPSPVTKFDPHRGDITHDLPAFLPDGRHFVYRIASSKAGNTGIYIGSLDARPEQQDSKPLLVTDFSAVYVPPFGASPGKLLFLRDGALVMQPLDANRLELTGEPVPVAEHVGFFRGYSFISASPNVLVYRTGGVATAQPTWYDRAGRTVGSAGTPGLYISLCLSPDGTTAGVSKVESFSSILEPAAWLLDLSRGTSTRFTFGSSIAVSPVWSPDGRRIIFGSGAPLAGNASQPMLDLYEKPASGVGEKELLLKSGGPTIPTSWSHDGRFLLYTTQEPKTGKGAVWVLPLDGDKKPFPFLSTGFNNVDGQFSPDGRLVAYVSDESGRNEIYVQTFSPEFAKPSPDSGGKWLISTNGGTQPRWRGDGKELYYLTPDGRLMAVEITTSPIFRAGQPTALFQIPPTTTEPLSSDLPEWDVASDGKHFLFLAPAAQSAIPFTVVLNWQAALKESR